MKYIFTFSYSSQWMDGFYQVIAESESQAIKMINHVQGIGLKLVSCYPVLNEDENKIIYSREIDNPAYEG